MIEHRRNVFGLYLNTKTNLQVDWLFAIKAFDCRIENMHSDITLNYAPCKRPNPNVMQPLPSKNWLQHYGISSLNSVVQNGQITMNSRVVTFLSIENHEIQIVHFGIYCKNIDPTAEFE